MPQDVRKFPSVGIVLVRPARTILALAAGVACLCGCRADGGARSPATAPSGLRRPGAPGLHLVREARPADLRYEIAGIGIGPNGFPDVRTRLTNASGEEVLVAYEPRRVLVHVDSYVRPGRDRTFPGRRQLLAPGESMPVDPPAGDWIQVAPDRQIELMVPTRLPPGRYSAWATFIVGDPHTDVLDTEHVAFEAR